jgi:peptidoglycan/LPS O-acetylase OafA/YrhL
MRPRHDDNDRFRYLPFLDGFRAVSIAMVAAWHASGIHTILYTRRFEVWLGVDAFFVLSGFLITSLLVQERQDAGAFSLRSFYARRFLRISPAYVVFLVSMLLYYGRPALRALAMCAVYLNNYDHGREWGFYASYPGGLEAIVPTWSLCIEEQFYILWPLVLSWVGHRDDADPARFPRALKFALAAAAAVILFKAALLFHDPGVDDKRIYFSFETRSDSVLIGCCAALAWANPRLRERIRAGLAGRWTPGVIVAALVLAVQNVRTSEQTRLFPRLMAWVVSLPMFSVLVAALILTLVIHPSSAPARFLSRPAMRWIGRLSYSIYLWHNFALEETKQLAGAVAHALPWATPTMVELLTDAMGLGLGLALACLSYYLIEKPFLRYKRRFEVVPSAATTAAPAPAVT